jgi:hypothetical protein
MGFEKKSRPAARGARTTEQTIPNLIGTPLSMDQQDFDTDAMFTPTDTKIYAKRFSGYYLMIGCLGFSANNTGCREALIRVNGSTYIGGMCIPTQQNDVTVINIHSVWYMNVNDYAELLAIQTSGGNLTLVQTSYLNWFSIIHQSGR